MIYFGMTIVARLTSLVLSILLFLSISSHGLSALADALPEGKKQITLIGADGKQLPIGSIVFTPGGPGMKFAVTIAAPEFGEEFLSMRPFRCLAGAKETWCYLPYPYETSGEISAEDLRALEYNLLFLFKPPSGYGIDAWNGLYFKLKLDEKGEIRGNLHETDLNVLAVPPEDLKAHLIARDALTPVSPEAHRYPRIEIR